MRIECRSVEEAFGRSATDELIHPGEPLSEFAAQLSAWFKDTYPVAPAVSASFVEAAIRDTWHRRHEVIGSEL